MIYLNDVSVNTTMFPDGTTQVWKVDEKAFRNNSEIFWDYSHEGELIQIVQLVQLCRARGVYRITLNVPRLPYARQDKWIANDVTFALHSFAHVLNSLDFDKVVTLDAHSEIAKILIDNLVVSFPEAQWRKAISACHINKEVNLLFCFPDAGARSKYAGHFGYPYPAYGEKVRDPATGRILTYALYGESVKDREVLIIDDICDGGATFVLLAKALKEAGAKTIDLFVTHGIFSQGTRILFNAGIRRIFTSKGEVESRFGDQQ